MLTLIHDGDARICRGCDEDVRHRPHLTSCPVVTRLVVRLGVTPRDAHLDSLLEACTRRAIKAWAASGRTL